MKEINLIQHLKYVGAEDYEKKDGTKIVLHKWVDHTGSVFQISGDFVGEVGKYYYCNVSLGSTNKDGYKKYWRFTPQDPSHIVVQKD